MIDLKPTKCNLCGGDVVYTSNSAIYGREYGSGKCYLCTDCKSYVGTHKPRPEEALGILANCEMRELKKKCHYVFDKMWKNRKERKRLYAKLASEMGIDIELCHFGYFDLAQLKTAYQIIEKWESGETK